MTDLPGVGYSMRSKLQAMGVTTCGDLRLVSLQKLQETFGPKTGQSLYNNCRGIDDREIKTDHQRQSVSAEINYGIRFVKVYLPFISLRLWLAARAEIMAPSISVFLLSFPPSIVCCFFKLCGLICKSHRSWN